MTRASEHSPVLIRNSRLFDGERVPSGLYDVLIEQGRVASIGKGLSLVAGGSELDRDGAWLMPGLIDTHIHSTIPSELPVYLRNGVTTIRYAGNPPGSVEALRREVEAHHLSAPRIHTCGPMLDAAPLSYPSYSVQVDTPGEMREVAQQLAVAGVDALIVVQHITVPLLEAAVTVAREHEIPVVGQIWAMNATEASRAGINQLDNTSRILESPVLARRGGRDQATVADRIALMRQAWLDVDWTQTEAHIAAMVDAQVIYCPTLVRVQWVAGLEPGTLESLQADRDADAFDADAHAQWREKVSVGQTTEDTKVVREEWRRASENMLEWIARFHTAGGMLAAGSDTQFGGIMLHHELRNLQAAGLSNLDVLRAATSISGRALGLRTPTGRLTVGALADLILLPSDPTLDLGALRDPSLVIVGGCVVLEREVEAQER